MAADYISPPCPCPACTEKREHNKQTKYAIHIGQDPEASTDEEKEPMRQTFRLPEGEEMNKEQELKEQYFTLRYVLNQAFKQASEGKGKDRHAIDAPFEEQKSCHIARQVGIGYPIGQAVKKAIESQRLDIDAAQKEILGAIVYLSMAHIILDEQREET